MSRSRKMIIEKYGRDFWDKFKSGSDKLFREVLKETPDIGESVFSFNYAYAPSYVAWYKTMRELSLTAEQADELMWLMNEKMLLTVPKPFLHMAGKTYLNGFRKKRQSIWSARKTDFTPLTGR